MLSRTGLQSCPSIRAGGINRLPETILKYDILTGRRGRGDRQDFIQAKPGMFGYVGFIHSEKRGGCPSMAPENFSKILESRKMIGALCGK